MRTFQKREVKQLGRQVAKSDSLRDQITDTLNSLQTKFDERASVKHEKSKYLDAFDSEFYACVVFQTREQEEAFLRALGLDAMVQDKFIDGVALAKALKIALPPAPKLLHARQSKFAELAGDV